MIEPYQWIQAHLDELGLSQDAHVGPASVDLHLLQLSALWKDGELEPCTKTAGRYLLKDIYLLRPGILYLGSTEPIRMPKTHAGFLQMRSTWARRGLGHKYAGYIDPGFYGEITLELETLVEVYIPVGERICQVVYQRLTAPTEAPYTGKYNGQKGPTQG
jgi:dCTP deaminase